MGRLDHLVLDRKGDSHDATLLASSWHLRRVINPCVIGGVLEFEMGLILVINFGIKEE